MNDKLTTLAVSGLRKNDPLLQIFEEILPLRFEHEPESKGQGAKFIVRTPAGAVKSPHEGSTLELALAMDLGKESRQRIQFADAQGTPQPFRGRNLETQFCADAACLVPGSGEMTLAFSASGPLWVVEHSSDAMHFRSAFAWPEIADDSAFFEVFNSRQFIALLPTLDFLRTVSGESDLRPNKIRASFVIDDPNLHWIRYGFTDYEAVVRHATRHNYHMSFATIPLDTWYTHKKAASIFSESFQRVSLLVHGNNHEKAELAASYSDGERDALLLESVQRMQRFSARSGVPFSRVMVPPHGACSQHMLAGLPRHGYEAACISSGSLRHHNRNHAWTRAIGYRLSELVGTCPVLPRWGLKNDVDNAVLLAAYLGQAIVIMGHHADMADELAEFDRVANVINGLGEVAWTNMSELARLNYVSNEDGTTLHIRAHGSVIQLPAASRFEHLVVRPSESRKAEIRIPYPAAHGLILQIRDSVSSEFSPRAATTHTDRAASATAFGNVPFKAALRRLATEGRDRLTPAYSRLFNS